MSLESRLRGLLATAGIEVDGGQPWDISIHNPGLYRRVALHGSLGLGESYMDGWWDCPALDQFFLRLMAAGLDRRRWRSPSALLLAAGSILSNRQTRSRSTAVALRHYDAGNELFQAMLDSRMVYTTGHWQGVSTLDQAQEAKLDFICRQLQLRPGLTVLDIGCGWGSFARFAAERYGASVQGITLSQQQLVLGRQLCAGLPVTLSLRDYRDEHGRFDRVVSLGMFEHVGYRNYSAFFSVARQCLAPDGLMFLSTIGSNHSVYATDPWIERYIFPNSHLPSIQQIGAALQDRFLLLDWRNWAADYDRTLMAWHANFTRGWDHWRQTYGERFCRMWRYYLLASAAGFRAHRMQVWQVLLQPL